MGDVILGWGPRFTVGNEDINLQHKMIVNLINYLANNSGDTYTNQEVGEILDELMDYTVYHFSFEEKLLAAHPGIKEHCQAHRSFIEQMSVFERKFYLGQEKINGELFSFLIHWLREHILETDALFFHDLENA